MNKGKIFRLNKVLREFNISLDRAIEFLANKQIEIEARPTTKIDEITYIVLKNEFSNKKSEVTGQSKSTSDKQEIELNSSTGLDSNLSSHFEFEEELEDENHSEFERNKKIWHKYITAQEKIIDFRSLPIAINPYLDYNIEGNTLKLEVDQDIFKKIFKEEVMQVFKLDEYDFDTNHILQDLEITDQINFDDLTQLKDSAEAKYIEFNEHPIIEGVIKEKNKNNNELQNIIGKLPNNYLFNKKGLILLTQKKHEQISQIKNISFEKSSGAVYPVYPNLTFLLRDFYKNPKIEETGNRFTVFNGKLHTKIEKFLEKEIDLQRKRCTLRFQFSKNSGIIRKVKDLDEFNGIELPSPKNDCIRFRIDPEKNNDSVSLEEQNSDLRREIQRITKVINQYFSNDLFQIDSKVQYRYDSKKLRKFFDKNDPLELRFWDRIYPDVHGDDFQISSDKGTLSFDFNSFEELELKKDELNEYDYFYIEDYRDDHKFKFNIKFETGLHEVQKKLKIEASSLSTRLISNGQKLKFHKHYKPGDKGFVRDYLVNVIGEHIKDEKYDVFIDDTFKEKYLCIENFELKVEQEEEKLSKLKRETFYYADKNNKSILGKLQKVDYPIIEFYVDDLMIDDVEENLKTKSIQAIFPDLKGERDKILRLKNTVNKLDSKVSLPNNNSRNFLFDSSKAKPIEDLETLLNQSGDSWKLFNEYILSKHLNASQKEAIFKSLYSEDLMLIQGPPGTGKSTAIAEIIWHHILRNPEERILLTSETNLAVDNAMDRIKNGTNNLVKPVRFGNEDRLASEGLFYSYETILSFESDHQFNKPNAIAHWIQNVSRRVTGDENEKIDNALGKWKSYLLEMNDEVRSLFSTQYLENVNLIGATGSSMGKLISEGRYTSFFHSYLKIFHTKDYYPKINYRKCNDAEIVLDTVIMDEASKATPPELALPIIYGKKAIIVGDHRQLPPMVDGEEIKDTLYSIGEKELAKTLERDEFKKSQFENLFLNEKIHPSLKGTFNTQYRMHPAINDVVKQFYIEDGGLTCGLPLEEIHHRFFSEPSSRYHGLGFKDILTPETHTMWIDVDSPEIKEGTSRSNLGEVEAINLILHMIKNSDGLSEYNDWITTQPEEEREIGVISFYGKQINHLKRMLENNHNDLATRLSTVDKFQGMERNIIIVSMVRSNKIATTNDQMPDFTLYENSGFPEQSSLGFAESPNRLNVGLSRARRLLIIVGNKEHFCKKEIYKNVFNTIHDSTNGMVISENELKNKVIIDEQ